MYPNSPEKTDMHRSEEVLIDNIILDWKGKVTHGTKFIRGWIYKLSRLTTQEMIQVFYIYSSQLVVWLLLEASSLFPAWVCWAARTWIAAIMLKTFLDWLDWRQEFSQRFKRGDTGCASHHRRPDLKGRYGGSFTRFNNLSKHLTDLLNSVQGNFPGLIKESVQVQQSKKHLFHRNATATALLSPESELDGERAKETGCMDHIHMAFSDYLWCSWFIFPQLTVNTFVGNFTTGNGILGVVKLRVRELLGLTDKMSSAAAEKVLLNVILNTSLATWITELRDQKDGTLIGEIFVPNATHIRCDKTVTSGDFKISIDITNGSIIQATFSGESLEFQDALVIAFQVWTGHQHAVIHSYANWCVNTDAPNAFIRRMSVITLRYNHIGFLTYPYFIEKMLSLGILKYCGRNLAQIVLHHGSHSVPKHAHLIHLKKHSTFINFVVQLRRFFLAEFVNHQQDFPGMDGEALFLGTVLHSVDHRQGGYFYSVAALSGSGNPEFLADVEWAALTYDITVGKPPLRMFECRFSHAPHPFYRKVYEFAATIDRRLADYMECCIAM